MVLLRNSAKETEEKLQQSGPSQCINIEIIWLQIIRIFINYEQERLEP
jgi:hypothetical protein